MRDVYYLTDAAAVQVFSRTQSKWLSPIPIPMPSSATSQRLFGIALSSDSTKLAISDVVADVIYVLNLATPSVVTTFAVQNAGGNTTSPVPGGLAISNQGVVYFAAWPSTSKLAGLGAVSSLYKLDTTSGTISTPTGYPTSINELVRPTPDDNYVFTSGATSSTDPFQSPLFAAYLINTSTDAMQSNQSVLNLGDLAISSDGATFDSGGVILDNQLNQKTYLNAGYGNGQKLSPDGQLLFTPLANSITVASTASGQTITSVALPSTFGSFSDIPPSEEIQPAFDALVSDGKDNIMVAITGTNGSGGVAVVDLSSISASGINFRKPAASKAIKKKKSTATATTARRG